MRIEDVEGIDAFACKMRDMNASLRAASWSLKDIREGKKPVYVGCRSMLSPLDVIDGPGAEELKIAICTYLESRCEELASKICSASLTVERCSKDELRQSLPVDFPDWKAEKGNNAI